MSADRNKHIDNSSTSSLLVSMSFPLQWFLASKGYITNLKLYQCYEILRIAYLNDPIVWYLPALLFIDIKILKGYACSRETPTPHD